MGKGSKPPVSGRPQDARPRPTVSPSSAMPRPWAPLESLVSPPSPPLPPPNLLPPGVQDVICVDIGSESSELTEDEQDSAETKSKANVRKQSTRRTRKSLIPDQLWEWYKKKKPLSDEKSNHSELPDTPAHTGHHVAPALYLYPLDNPFVLRHIALLPRQRVTIGRQTNAKTAPAKHNGYFDSKALSRQHAEVWEEDGKVITNLLFLSSRLGT